VLFIEVKRSAAIIMTVVATWILAAPAPAQQFVMKSGIATRSDIQNEWQNRMKERIEARSAGRLKIEIYVAGQLGSNQVMIDGMQLGTVENFIAPGSFFVGVDPRFQILDVPGVFKDVDHLYATVRDPEFRRAYLDIGRAKELIGIGLMVYGPTSFITRKPVRAIGDFRGLKLRVFASPLQTEPVKLLGAAPTPMGLSEVLPAFQNQVIDGMLSGITVFTTFRYYDLTKYLTETGYSMITSMSLVSKPWFDKLPADLRTMVIEEADALEPDLYKWGQAENDNAAKVWTGAGGELIHLPPADQAEMMRRIAVVAEQVLGGNPATKDLYNVLKTRAAAVATR